MEIVIAATITGCLSIFLAILQQNWSSRKTNKQIIEKLDSLNGEIESMGIDLMQLKMDKYIAKYNSHHQFTEEAIKELNETYERYHKLGGNGYYAHMIKKIISRYSDQEEVKRK